MNRAQQRHERRPEETICACREAFYPIVGIARGLGAVDSLVIGVETSVRTANC